MKSVDWLDDDGCLQRALLPDGVPDEQAPTGLPIGVEIELGMSEQEQTRCRLQNELRRRGLWTAADVRRRKGAVASEVFAALQAALRVDVASILNQYALAEKAASQRKEQPNG